MTPDIADDEASGDPTYAFKPSLIGSRASLRSGPTRWNGRSAAAAAASVTRRSGTPAVVSAGDDETHRFITEFWSAGNPKIQIVSVSWRSIMEQERLDNLYSAFVTELHRRVAAAGGVPSEALDRPAAYDLLGRRRYL